MLDVLAFSSLWVAAAAAALAAACSLAMGIPVSGAAVGLAFAGTLVVYNVDRLRDLDADRTTAPDRSAFIAAHGGGLALLTVASALASLTFALAAGPRAFAVLVPILGLGLLHRRLKQLGFGKSAYLATAWIGVVVGVPALIDPAATQVEWTLGITAPALFANAIASNIRDVEVVAARFGSRPALTVAQAFAVLGVAIAATAPVPARSLMAVPVTTLLALLLFRPGERYGLLIVDGALLAGAIVAGGVAVR
jgi:hypothetical protein